MNFECEWTILGRNRANRDSYPALALAARGVALAARGVALAARGVAVEGGFGGPGGGARGGGRGRNLDANRLHGSLHYSSDDSALDAAPYSLTGHPASKPAYQQNTFGGTIGGPLAIPRIYKGDGKTFIFVNYNGTRSGNPFDAFSTVPTLEERAGNFSDATYSSPGANGQQAQLPVELFYPTNGQYAEGRATDTRE
jgi:hypothetical protein